MENANLHLKKWHYVIDKISLSTLITNYVKEYVFASYSRKLNSNQSQGFILILRELEFPSGMVP